LFPAAQVSDSRDFAPAARPVGQQELWLDLLHVAGLTGLAIAQPILDLLGRQPTFFVAHRTSPAELLLLVAAICLGVPVLAALIEIPAAWIWPAGRRAFQTLLIGLLAVVAATNWLKRLPGFDGWGGVIAGVLVGVALAWNYRRAAARSFFTLLACLAMIVPMLFLSREGVRKIWQPAAASAAGPTEAWGNGKRVVLVILDELPLASLLNGDAKIDAGRFPNFARLAERSHWFVKASSVHQRTPQAVPAILTGCYPKPDQLPLASDHPHNLFALLSEQYEQHVSEPLTMLYRPGDQQVEGPSFWLRSRRLVADTSLVALHVLLPGSWTTELPAIDENWADFWPAEASGGPNWRDVVIKGKSSYDDRPEQFARFLEAIQPVEKPQLNFIHILLPHGPWCYLPNGIRYTNTGVPAGEAIGLRNLDEWSVVQAYQRHMSQLQYTDQLLGGLLDRLQSQQLWDDSLVVVTADHGASFWPGGSRRDADATPHPEDILSVPLWIKLPGQTAGQRHTKNVETVDILPTIAMALEQPLPWQVDGWSVFDDAAPPRSQKTIYNDDCVARQFPADFLDITASLERKQSIFGEDASPFWLYRIGPLPEYIGRDATSWIVSSDESSRLELDQPALYEQIDRSSPFVPALISGRILRAGDAAETEPLAVTVNGVLWGVTQAGQQAGNRGAFTALVPATAFFDGKNRVEIFRVRSTDRAAPQLVALGNHVPRAYALRTSTDHPSERLIAPDGTVMTVMAEGVRGIVDRIITTGGGVELSGWAADEADRHAIEQIVVFQGTRFLTSARPTMVRGDNEKEYGRSDAIPTGFGIFISERLLDPKAPPKLRAFAVTKRGSVTELPQKLWLGNRFSAAP